MIGLIENGEKVPFISLESFIDESKLQAALEEMEAYKVKQDTEGAEVFVFMNTETELPIGAELPEKLDVLITYCENGVKGDTATRALKAATIESGATVMVPLFVNEGEKIKINTKNGEYVERVK
jgi:elongation factor P